nr:MAG TPA: hypothetical protein [Caudoviricetes sp.]
MAGGPKPAKFVMVRVPKNERLANVPRKLNVLRKKSRLRQSVARKFCRTRQNLENISTSFLTKKLLMQSRSSTLPENSLTFLKPIFREPKRISIVSQIFSARQFAGIILLRQ